MQFYIYLSSGVIKSITSLQLLHKSINKLIKIPNSWNIFFFILYQYIVNELSVQFNADKMDEFLACTGVT